MQPVAASSQPNTEKCVTAENTGVRCFQVLTSQWSPCESAFKNKKQDWGSQMRIVAEVNHTCGMWMKNIFADNEVIFCSPSLVTSSYFDSLLMLALVEVAMAKRNHSAFKVPSVVECTGSHIGSVRHMMADVCSTLAWTL